LTAHAKKKLIKKVEDCIGPSKILFTKKYLLNQNRDDYRYKKASHFDKLCTFKQLGL